MTRASTPVSSSTSRSAACSGDSAPVGMALGQREHRLATCGPARRHDHDALGPVGAGAHDDAAGGEPHARAVGGGRHQ